MEEMPLPLGNVISTTDEAYEVEVDLNEVQKVVESEKFSKYLIDNATTMGTVAFIIQKVLLAVAEEKANEAIERMVGKENG